MVSTCLNRARAMTQDGEDSRIGDAQAALNAFPGLY